MPQSGRSVSVWLRIMVTCLSRAIPWRKCGLHQGTEGGLAFIRCFIKAHDKFLVSLYTGGNFLFERVNRHS